ncbi:RNA--NAD 2'-phosphotransferase [Micromonospora craterilacus]|uniref:Probable RNA 2'-phosphotransferase n=1 Tax=Micromonospora craterilacus TaxID=1655439 RepID=A0A2W2ET78_9ACTN|nr:RNA 2'-phosphotransferase [Micromonospora craterilacus]PZG12587.1 RNA--NAD 2'-phosphotransferase [Micromonospora craterilacus]
MTDQLTALSKLLAYVLRHRPGAVGVALDDGGWVDVDVLLTALARHGRPVTPDLLDRLVAGTDKQRFEVRGGRIRAAQGHSIAVDLRLAPATPPPVLYHGTVARFLAGIGVEGLQPRGRTHVHLSADQRTAATVGARRGEPVILSVDAAGMHRSGFAFYRAVNGVWLTSHVPPPWITSPRSGND